AGANGASSHVVHGDPVARGTGRVEAQVSWTEQDGRWVAADPDPAHRRELILWPAGNEFGHGSSAPGGDEHSSIRSHDHGVRIRTDSHFLSYAPGREIDHGKRIGEILGHVESPAAARAGKAPGIGAPCSRIRRPPEGNA